MLVLEHRQLADRLLATLSTLRRRIRRSFGRPFGSRLSHAQGELVRHVRRHPGASVKETARALALAPNTVSTLVACLVGEGFLERESDPNDQRVARLTLTEQARVPLESWRNDRVDALARVLASLTPQQIDELDRGLAVLDQLAGRLAEGSEVD